MTVPISIMIIDFDDLEDANLIAIVHWLVLKTQLNGQSLILLMR
jgi:hypothetical protein